MTYGHKWYVHSRAWFSALSNSQWDQGCQKIVIDQSMTILKQPFRKVIDRSLTIFACIRNGLSQKIVIDRSMTVSEGRHRGPMCTFTKLSLTGQWHFWLDLEWVITENCHWPVNDSFGGSTPWTKVHLYKIVIDRSMTVLIELIQKLSLTGQWQFSEGSTPCGEVHLYKLSLTGQWQFWSSNLRMSLTGQLQFLLALGMGHHRKLSLTGQWQFSGSPGPLGVA